MKILNTTITVFTIALALLCIFFFCSSIDLAIRSNASTTETTYSILSKYSGLYKFTFIVIALYVTLRQLRLSQETNKRTLDQLKFTQEDIELKRIKEVSVATLEHCNYYLEEIQLAYKELIETGILSGMPIDWNFLKKLTTEGLKETYAKGFTKFDSEIERGVKNKVLITLYKLESFSSLFIYGNLNKTLAEEIIGYTFARQVCFLLGLIAYFRESETSMFGKNTISLYREWEHYAK